MVGGGGCDVNIGLTLSVDFSDFYSTLRWEKVVRDQKTGSIRILFFKKGAPGGRFIRSLANLL